MLLSIDSKIELSIDKNKASCVRKLYIYGRICPLVKPLALKKSASGYPSNLENGIIRLYLCKSKTAHRKPKNRQESKKNTIYRSLSDIFHFRTYLIMSTRT